MADQATDFLKAGFLRDYQALAQQSWDAWVRQVQQPGASASFFKAPPPPPSPTASAADTLERTLAGLKGYFDWMQGAAATGSGVGSGDWRQQLEQWFGGANQPFAQAFGGIDSAGAQGFSKQWESWLQAMQRGGLGEMPGAQAAPAFGLNREQQMQQQALLDAMQVSMQSLARYQGLIQRANTQGMQRLQEKLAAQAGSGQQVDSLKALYGLWVDAAEEAYAEIALSDEFREAYGEMVNTQMQVRQLQQQQTEQICRELGMPTRSEVSSLGERLQQLRREVRAGQAPPDEGLAEQLLELRREVAALRRELAASKGAVSTAVKKAPARAAAKAPAKAKKPLAVKKAVSKVAKAAPAKVTGKVTAAGKPRAPAKSPTPAKPRPAAASRATPRKRK